MAELSILSPVTGCSATRHVGSRNVGQLIDGYKSLYQIDVSEYFRDLTEIEIRECVETGYRFFYPFSLAGKESLYRHLQQFDWNYKSDKWEYQRALLRVRPGDRILDVGCGEGGFLDMARKKGAHVHGIEMNLAALMKAKERGHEVSSRLISEFASTDPASYDIVCSFQVLEHVVDVKSFINGCVDVLKPGGLLIFGVPNNDGFLKIATDAVLNAPPHHMGLWSIRSLSALSKFFSLEVKAMEIEPLQEPEWYASVMERRYITNSIARSVYYRLGISKIFRNYVEENAEGIAGHTVLGVYEKMAL